MPLSLLLRLNASSCLIFGFIFVAIPSVVSTFLGGFPALILLILGGVLCLHGFHFLWASFRSPIKLEIQYFSLGDFLWVLGSLALIVMKLWITSVIGLIATIFVAGFVGTLGVLQWKATKTI